MKSRVLVARLLATALALAGAQAMAAEADWPHYGGDLGSSKYSPLDQIDRLMHMTTLAVCQAYGAYG